jgi:hypothetical protein
MKARQIIVPILIFFGRRNFLFFRQVVGGWIHFSSYGLKVGEIYIDYIRKI